MTSVTSSGSAPGWISRHRADLLGNGVIRVRGGQCWDGERLSPAPAGDFLFDVRTRRWSHQA
ncbi:MAG: hypothetical protein JNM94_14095 [Phycisphaerae bacterium]|nr:hypothetical protein [Phycisphaerae bacterium]